MTHFLREGLGKPTWADTYGLSDLPQNHDRSPSALLNKLDRGDISITRCDIGPVTKVDVESDFRIPMSIGDADSSVSIKDLDENEMFVAGYILGVWDGREE